MSKLKPSTRVWALSIVSRDEPRLDRRVVVEAHPLHEAGHPVRREPLHQVVVEREVEARRARVALARGAAAQLVVDAPALVALGADDVQAAGRHDRLVVDVDDRLRLLEGRRVRLRVDLRRVQPALVEDVRRESRRVAAELDVRAAARHVGRDRDGAGTAGLRDDARLLLVELGVQRLVLDPAPLEQRREDLGLLDGHRADQDRPTGRRHLLDLVDQRVELGRLVLVDEVRVVVADHRAVGGDRHHLEGVDLVELLGLGHRRAGHARELVVQAEVVLEGDRRERPALALDAHPLLRLDRLVQALAPPAPGILRPVNSSTMTISPSSTM